MTGGVIEPLVLFWNAWGIQVVVLLSFMLQVTLLVTADLRRRRESTMLKIIIWSAYVLADTTAVYALGHMSVMSGLRRLPQHGLLALWAPLLIVHLGGQDNITAYAIEDNQLWLRHLQIFIVQVVAAAYILYGSSIVLSRRTRLLEACILMFVVGVLKHGERVWALMHASSSASSSLSATSYNKAHFSSVHQHQPAIDELVPTTTTTTTATARVSRPRLEQADLPLVAYRLLDVPKQLFERPTRYVEVDSSYGSRFNGAEMLQVVRIQLQMMYDLLYTKAAVLHTWYGWSIRAISLPATVAALLLFHAEDHQHQDVAVDVVVTYVLLGGAVVLDMASILRAMCSRWTYVHLRKGKWRGIARFAGRLGRQLAFWPEASSYMRGMSMGQHSLSSICARSRNSKSSKVARWIGREDWWDSRFHSWSTPVLPLIIFKVVELVSRDEDITNSRGRDALVRYLDTSVHDRLIWALEDLDMDESILVWHIATGLYLYLAKRRSYEVTEASEALSNYLFFLLAGRPNMLPYPVSRQGYVRLCYDVITHFRSMPLVQELAQQEMDNNDSNATLKSGVLLGRALSEIAAEPFEDGPLSAVYRQTTIPLEDHCARAVDSVLLEVWVQILCYTAYRCNENSHAKQLGSGGELMTTVALLMLYNSRGLVTKQKQWLPQPVLPEAEEAVDV